MRGAPPRRRLAPLVPLLAALLCPACEEEPEDPACEFAGDGVCDEPVNCALGTDEADCVAACDAGEDLHLFAAACAFRDPPAEPPDDGVGSGGTLHLTGWHDASVVVPSGEDLDLDIERHYRLFVPQSYDPERTHPLVVMMPGHRVCHYDLARYTQLPRTADQYGFLVVDAEQQYRWSGEHRWAWWTDWNWSGDAEANPDFDYLRAVIEAVQAGYNVDRSRIFLAGHSRGGAMAFIGALEMPDLIAGACVQSGFTEFGYLDARLTEWDGRHVPMVFMHGQDDGDVPVAYADAMVDRLLELGWEEDQEVLYYRLDNVTHRWQDWLNDWWWAYLYERPLPVED